MKNSHIPNSLTDNFFNNLFQNHWTEVYSFAKIKTRDHHKAEDLTCETFIKGYLYFESYNPDKNFKNWIFKICENTFIDSLIKQDVLFKSHEYDQCYHLNNTAPINNTAPTPLDKLILKDRCLDLLKAIGQLKKVDQEIINLFYIEDLSYNEISDSLNISYTNARTKLYRAKHKLLEKIT